MSAGKPDVLENNHSALVVKLFWPNLAVVR